MGSQQFGVDPAVVTRIAHDVGEIQGLGVQTAIVIGGGNIFRGLAASVRGMDRSTADYMGMLATVINGLTPCAVARPARLAAKANPRLRSSVTASSMLPSASVSAALHSIMPAPVLSRSCFT